MKPRVLQVQCPSHGKSQRNSGVLQLCKRHSATTLTRTSASNRPSAYRRLFLCGSHILFLSSYCDNYAVILEWIATESLPEANMYSTPQDTDCYGLCPVLLQKFQIKKRACI